MPTRDTVADIAGNPAPAVSPTLRFWIVPHTHWDREWYLPFEQLRVRLGRVMDEVLDALERDPSLCFSLDGQAILLEDYLELRPDQEPRLRRLLASGRLACGPSYILPDEFLAGQESLVRNLLMGRQVCSRFGAPPMSVAYAPDTFGHVAQLPQILRGFGIDSFIFWRGLGDEAESLGAVFQWQGHDSCQVMAVRLLGGYAAHKDLGRWTRSGGPVDDPARWAETAPFQIREHLERFSAQFGRAGLADILICNGDDHEAMQSDLPEMVEACRRSFPGASFQVATFPEYVDSLRWRANGTKIHRGELVGGYEACVVRGVNSTRIYLKQTNEATERRVQAAETLAALAYLRTGKAYPLREVQLAWRELLKNHPHDSLPGCSLDEVHSDMEQRFRSASQIATEVSRDAMRQLAAAGRPARPWMEDLSERSLVNTLPWKRKAVVELDLPDTLARSSHLAADALSWELPVQPHGSGTERRALLVVELPGFASRGLRLLPAARDTHPARAISNSSNSIENEFYRVEVAPNGTLDVTDLATGQTWDGMHWFQDEADRGDEYSFCPVTGELGWDSRGLQARTRVAATGPLVAELRVTLTARLPRGLLPGRRARSKTTVACRISTVIRLTAGIDRIEFRTTVDNRAKEHRLRVVFPSPGSGHTVRAESAFAMVRRPARPVWNGRWREPPADTHHTSGVVAAGRLSLMSKGLPEYEAIPNGDGIDLALTLLRSVGFLSWGDLETRVGAQEPHISTPDAQCLGRHEFEYAVSLRGDADDACLLRASQDYRTEFAVGPRGADFNGVFQIDGSGFAFSALKGAEDGRGAILRLYNPGQNGATAHLSGQGLSFHRCQMDETDTQPGAIHEVAMRPGEIVTLRLEPTTG